MTKTKRNNECHLEFVQNKFAKRNNESNMNRAVDISSGSCQSIPIFATYSCPSCLLFFKAILIGGKLGQTKTKLHTDRDGYTNITERRMPATLALDRTRSPAVMLLGRR